MKDKGFGKQLLALILSICVMLSTFPVSSLATAADLSARTSEENDVLIFSTSLAKPPLVMSYRLEYIAEVYEENGYTVKQKLPSAIGQELHLTAEDMQGIGLFILYFPYQNLNENDIALLCEFLQGGGRIVMIAEYGKWSPTENTIMSQVAEKLGGNFQISTISQEKGDFHIAQVNTPELPDTALTEGVELGLSCSNIAPISYSGSVQPIIYYYDYAWSVEQAVENGRILSIADINCFDPLFDDHQSSLTEQENEQLKNDVKTWILNWLEDARNNQGMVATNRDPNLGFGGSPIVTADVGFGKHASMAGDYSFTVTYEGSEQSSYNEINSETIGTDDVWVTDTDGNKLVIGSAEIISGKDTSKAIVRYTVEAQQPGYFNEGEYSIAVVNSSVEDMAGKQVGGKTIAHFAVYALPVNICEPENISVPMNGYASLSASAQVDESALQSGPFDYSYQWQRKIGAGYETITGATSSTYVLPESVTGNPGEYIHRLMCTVTSPTVTATVYSQDATVTVQQGASIGAPAASENAGNYTLSAELLNAGSETIVETGFVWGIMGSPTVSLNNGKAITDLPVTSSGNSISVTADNIAAGVGYSARAYAKISDDNVIYSPAVSFGSTGNLGTFFVESNGDGSFTVTLEGGKGEQMVFYRTVNGSAVGGTHFEHSSGVLVFEPGETTKIVAVNEYGVNSAYQDNVTTSYSNVDRSYCFELYKTMGGATIDESGAKATRTMTGAQNVDETVFDDFLITADGTNHDHGDYDEDKLGWTTSGKYYSTAKETLNVQEILLQGNNSAQQNYWQNLAIAEIQYRMTFQAKEVDDGYQHIQIALGENIDLSYDPYEDKWESNSDNLSANNGTALYQVTFRHGGNSQNGNWASYYLPNTSGSPQGCSSWSETFNNGGGSSGSSYITLPVDQIYMTVGYAASGKGNDKWTTQNEKYYFRIGDTQEPQLLAVAPMAQTAYSAGEEITISLIFDEIIDKQNSDLSKISISTNLTGPLSYAGGADTNVLYFTGTVTSSFSGGEIQVKTINGNEYIRDICEDHVMDNQETNGTTEITLTGVDKATVNIGSVTVENGSAAASVSATNADILKYCWTDSADMPAVGWLTAESADSATLSTPATAAGKWYLHVMAINQITSDAAYHSAAYSVEAKNLIYINVSADNTNWSQSRTIVLDGSGGTLTVRTPSGKTETLPAGTATYTAQENGEYTFILTNGGETVTKTVRVEKIDRTSPQVGFVGLPSDWQTQFPQVTITGEDGSSGLESLQYKLVTSKGIYPTEGLVSAELSGGSAEISGTRAVNGTNYIYYIAKDKAGNITQGYSTVIQIDSTVPTITVSASVSEGLAAMFSVSATYGVSGGEVTFTKVGDNSVWPVSGTVTDNGNGSYGLAANPGVSEEGTYQFTVTTGAGKTDTASAPATCKVTLDAGEGVFELDSQTTSTWLVVAGETITLPKAPMSEAPTRTGYILSGWYMNASLEEKYDDKATVNSDLTLYAGWQAETYSITYDLNGGCIEDDINPASYTVEDNTFTLKNPVKEGAIFLGWSGTDLTGDRNKTVTVAEGSTGNRAYIAHWSDVQVSMAGWIYGDSPKEPVLGEGSNPGNAAVTYTYYTDIGCTNKTSLADGTDTEGGRPAYAGTYYVKAEIAEADGYNAASATASFTIEQKTIGIQWGNTDFTYTGQAQVPTAIATGLVSGDVCSVTVSGTQIDANVKSGNDPYTATVADVSNKNYKLPNHGKTTSFTIIPAELTVEWGNTQFTYNGQSQAPVAMLSGIVKDEQVEVSVFGGQIDAGKYTAEALISDKNYVIKDGQTVSFKIEPKTLTDDMVSLGGGTLKEDSYEYTFTNKGIIPVVIVEDDNILTSGDYTISGDTEKTAYGQYTISVEGANNYQGIVNIKWNVTDPHAPSATITVEDNSWNKFWNVVTFGLFFKEIKRVTISGTDGENESGVDTVLYYTSETPAETADELVDVPWTEIGNNGFFNIEPNQKLFIYAKVSDKAGNSAVVNSNGIVLYTDAQQVTEELTYTRLDTEDLTAGVALNGNTVSEIVCGTTLLRVGTDYSVNNEKGSITFKADWLDTLTAGEYTLTIRYNPLGEAYPTDPSSDSAAPADTVITLTVQKAQGSATDISDLSRVYDGKTVDDVAYTAPSKGAVTVEYKQQDAADNTYTEEKPVDVGRYTVRVTVTEDEYYTRAYATADFAITYLETPQGAYTLSGDKGENGWYISDVMVKPADGYTIADSLNGAYADCLTLTESADENYKVYLKNENGQMTDAILVETVKIDKENPKITVTGSTEAYLQRDTVKIRVSDGISGVSKVEVSKAGGAFDNITNSYESKYTVSENGIYTFRVTDNAGRMSEEQICYDKLDSTKPAIMIDSVDYENGVWTNADITLSVSNTESNLGTTSFRYKVDDGEWQTYTDAIVVSRETDGTAYTFKAISASGVESDEVSIDVKIDKTVPSGDIKIRENSLKKLISVITFGFFFNESVDVTITGEDSLSGVSKIEYYRSEEILSQEQVNQIVEWTSYTSISETAENAKKFVYYVKITDNAGNVICFGSDGVIFDLMAPVIQGITNEATYYTTQKITITDTNLASVKLNSTFASFENGALILTGDQNANYTIEAIDKAGNKTEYTVFMKPIESLTEDIQSLTTETVTSANKNAINVVKDAIAGIDVTNATEEEKAALEAVRNSVEALLEQITVTETELSIVAGGVGSFDIESVKSADKDKIEGLVERIDTLLEGENLTEEEKTVLETVKNSAEVLLDQVAEAESAGHTENTGKVENITADNVIAKNAGDLTAAKEDLENALKKYGANYTEEEKTDLQRKLDQINSALESLENAEVVQDAITALPDTVKPDDMHTEQLINDVRVQYDTLTEHEKSLVSKEAKEKLESLLTALSYYKIIVVTEASGKKVR